MRIIGGEYRSRPLKAPRGMTTRPTLDQVREALFNILQGEIEGISMLDLYGGSGAVALEALSRGASRAVICDQSRDAVAVIRENIRSLGCSDRAVVLSGRDEQLVSRLSAAGESFDLIYLDPPYEMDPTKLIRTMASSGLVRPGGRVIREHAASSLPEEVPGLVLLSTRKYRDTCLTFYRREG